MGWQGRVDKNTAKSSIDALLYNIEKKGSLAPHPFERCNLVVAFYRPSKHMHPPYQYLVVGSGLYGAAFAYREKAEGKRVPVIEKRPHVGGNLYCRAIEGIQEHQYGAHIFHSNSKQVWNFVNSLIDFNRYTYSPIANDKGELYNRPFNMNTFHQQRGVTTPAEARAVIKRQVDAVQEKDVIFGGRLAQYKYYDMAPVIEQVLNLPLP